MLRRKIPFVNLTKTREAMYSCIELLNILILLTNVFSANALEDTFAGIKLYNSLEKSLLSKYGAKPDGIQHKGESLLDEYYAINTKETIPNHKNKIIPNADHTAFVKITNALYKRPVSAKYGTAVKDVHSKKILNGVLVAQLQSLLDSIRFLSMNDIIDNGVANLPNSKPTAAAKPIEMIKNTYGQPKEHLFLVLNEDLTTVTNDDLIYVDPNSLSEESTVFVLGGLNDLFSNEELIQLMQNVQTELLKPKYLPLLYTLSSGNKLQALNAELGANIFSGANARRYVKAHRCNYQSPLAKIKNGGPTWVICSGYLNINTPSYYDKK